MSHAADCLRGSPYLLPEDAAASRQVAMLVKQEKAISEKLSEVRQRLQAANLRIGTSDVQKTREIYESNSIEGIGPDLRGTWDVLRSDAAHSMSNQLDYELMTKSITDEADMRAVLTLHGARLLARQLRDSVNTDRRLSESDIRSIHRLICAGEGHEGGYKRYHVQIGGQDAHEPHLPIDVSPAMFELTDWFGRPIEGSAILRAAAVHAWLTHIHPFEDENGRLARLLANFGLAQHGLPPAIVKNSSQRGPYLDALRHSDKGGDILPLAGLFLSTLQRYVAEVSKPKFLRQVFEDELLRRGSRIFDWWSNELAKFLDSFHAELGFHRIDFEQVGSLDYDSFRQIQDLKREGNSWLELLRDSIGREILLWFGYPPVRMRERMDEGHIVPSIYFSVRAPEWRLRPFEQASPRILDGLSEVALVPGVPTQVYVLRKSNLTGDRLRTGEIDDAASEIAGIVSRSFPLVPKRVNRPKP